MKTKSITFIGLFTALLCIAAPLSIPIPVSPVPLSLATFIIYLFSNLLGYKKALLCCLIYFLIGLAGIPVFSGFSSGVSKLLGPTGGYLIGYFFLAFFTGFFADKFPHSIKLQLLGMIIGSAFLQCLGTLWLSILTHTTFLQASLSGVIPFLPNDILKIVIVIIIAPLIKKYMAKAQLSFE
ncbi:biotin transporter BioY [Clostridium sp. MD294]|uniref:biotin transporter BioY n=1 Tax=Clostridium sp. MD294 TaxID=97138 RepID=UPI0002CC12FD|nr:biotin transporter BioY [Clostridium sp. MD294]NDO47209.1 biotin transporter BioY [Clostridium sp. MD294]USF29727.1 Biotin transporter BioY [Clostridium sp. MD294]